MTIRQKIKDSPVFGGFYRDIESAFAEEAAEHGELTPDRLLDGDTVARLALRTERKVREGGRGPVLEFAKHFMRELGRRAAGEDEDEEIVVTQVEKDEKGSE